MRAPLDLRCGTLSCRIAPDLGGALLALRHGDRDVLRSGEAARHVLDTACFPLVPFANRIDHGRFTFDDQLVDLGTGALGDPHALHGDGWRQGWLVEQAGTAAAVLRFAPTGTRWPWVYSVRQTFTLDARGLSIELAVTNHDTARPMPVGTGLHPYFAAGAGVTVRAASTTMWHNDATGLARAPAPSTLFAGEPVPVDRLDGLDNFFAATAPQIVIARPGLATVVEGAGAGFHVYCPPGRGWFCVEPVDHAPNAFGRSEYGPGQIAAPGATVRRSYRFGVTADGDEG